MTFVGEWYVLDVKAGVLRPGRPMARNTRFRRCPGCGKKRRWWRLRDQKRPRPGQERWQWLKVDNLMNPLHGRWLCYMCQPREVVLTPRPPATQTASM